MRHPLSFFLYRLKYRFSRELRLHKPIDVSLELSSACDMACNYCYHSSKSTLPFKQGVMSLTTAKLILADAANLGVNSVKLNFRGESTLNPHFLEITKFAKDHAEGSTFIDRLTNSNFNFSNDKWDIFEGLCNQTKVKVSFDSFIPEVMEKQRAKSNHARILKNIDTFYNHPNRKDTVLVIQAVRTLLNKDEDIIGAAKKRWPEALVSIRDMVAGRVEKDLSEYENKKRDSRNRQPCIQASARLIFDWQGSAQACCPDTKSTLQFGNIHDKSIYEIFNSEKAIGLRKSLRNRSAFNLDPCKTCSSFESYRGYKHPWGS